MLDNYTEKNYQNLLCGTDAYKFIQHTHRNLKNAKNLACALVNLRKRLESKCCITGLAAQGCPLAYTDKRQNCLRNRYRLYVLTIAFDYLDYSSLRVANINVFLKKDAPPSHIRYRKISFRTVIRYAHIES